MTVNGVAGRSLRARAADASLLAFMVDGGRIVRVDVLRDPAKLRRL